MRILDFHAHCFPDAIAERAVAALAAAAGETAETNGTISELLGRMDACGVEKAVVASIATKPSQTASIGKWSQEIKSERLVPFTSVHPGSPSAAEEVGQAARAGFCGIKLHPYYQSFDVGEARMLPIYEAAAAHKMVLLIHAGHDLGFAGQSRGEPHEFVPVLNAFPGLKLVLAHFGGWRKWDEFLECLAGRDVYIDTSYVSGYCPDELVTKILRKHDSSRILFGSDSPWGRMDEQKAFVEKLPASDPVKEKIFFGNAAELLGITP